MSPVQMPDAGGASPHSYAKYKDIMQVDTNHAVYLSDWALGGDPGRGRSGDEEQDEKGRVEAAHRTMLTSSARDVEDVAVAQQDRVDAEEVAGDGPDSLGVKEVAPGRPVPMRYGPQAGPVQHPPNRAACATDRKLRGIRVPPFRAPELQTRLV